MRIQAEAGIGQFAEIGLADVDHPGAAQGRHQGGIPRRHRAAQANPGTGGGHAAGHVEEVLPGERYTIQRRQWLAGRPAGLCRPGFPICPILAQRDEGRGQARRSGQGRFKRAQWVGVAGREGLRQGESIGKHDHLLNVYLINTYIYVGSIRANAKFIIRHIPWNVGDRELVDRSPGKKNAAQRNEYFYKITIYEHLRNTCTGFCHRRCYRPNPALRRWRTVRNWRPPRNGTPQCPLQPLRKSVWLHATK